jgi:hypothetical protein
VTTRHYIPEDSAAVRTWNLTCGADSWGTVQDTMATSRKHGNERLGSMTDEEFPN